MKNKEPNKETRKSMGGPTGRGLETFCPFGAKLTLSGRRFRKDTNNEWVEYSYNGIGKGESRGKRRVKGVLAKRRELVESYPLG